MNYYIVVVVQQYYVIIRKVEENMRDRRRLRTIKNRRRVRRQRALLLVAVVLILGVLGVSRLLKRNNLEDEQAIDAPEINQEALQNPQHDSFESTIVTDNVNGIYDLKSDSPVYEKNTDKKVIPASLVKLFLIDYSLSIIDAEESIYVSDEVSLVKPGSSLANLNEGNYKHIDLIRAALIPSGNDAAYAIAVACGRNLGGDELSAEDAVSTFISNLNNYLMQNGYYNTHIDEPSGFSNGSYTSYNDLLEVTKKLVNIPVISEIFATKSYTYELEDGSSLVWTNTNELMNPESSLYNENISGIKTGSLDDVYNLISRYTINGKDYLIFVLDADDSDERFNETGKLIEELDQWLVNN